MYGNYLKIKTFSSTKHSVEILFCWWYLPNLYLSFSRMTVRYVYRTNCFQGFSAFLFWRVKEKEKERNSVTISISADGWTLWGHENQRQKKHRDKQHPHLDPRCWIVFKWVCSTLNSYHMFLDLNELWLISWIRKYILKSWAVMLHVCVIPSGYPSLIITFRFFTLVSFSFSNKTCTNFLGVSLFSYRYIYIVYITIMQFTYPVHRFPWLRYTSW